MNQLFNLIQELKETILNQPHVDGCLISLETLDDYGFCLQVTIQMDDMERVGITKKIDRRHNPIFMRLLFNDVRDACLRALEGV